MESIKQILQIINKRFETDLSLSNYTQIPLYSKQNSNPFEKELIRLRVNRIISLAMITQFTNSTFVVGNQDYFLTHPYDQTKEEEQLPPIPIGPCIVDQTYSQEEIFDYLLEDLAVAQIITTKHFSMHGQKRITTKGPRERETHLSENLKQEIFVIIKPKQNLILTETHVYVSPELTNKIQSIITQHQTIFTGYLEQYKDSITIPHSIYIVWLLKWFPGLIHIRSLE